MKKSKLSLLLILTLVLSMFLAACSGGGDKKNEGKETDKGGEKAAEEQLADVQELNVLESSEIPAMDSVLAEDTIGFTMISATQEGLYRLDPDQKVIPGIAEAAPEFNDEKTVLTIKLKKDVKWADGSPVTAKDFVYSWQRAINAETASPYGPYFMEGKIKGASEVVEATKAKVEKKQKVTPEDLAPLGIKALDDYTLQIELVRPISFIESYLTFPLFYPQNQKFVEAQGDKYASSAANLLSNGPFKMTKWDGPTATEWVLEKNENYWDAKNVALTKINFNVSKDPQASANAFTAGEADITPKLAQAAILSQYEGDPALLQYLEPSIFWIKMNQTVPALKNENIRRAIALSVDKQALVDDVLANGSIPANFVVPKGFAFHPESGKDFREKSNEFLKTNKEEAKKLWEKGLQELGVKEVKLVYVGGDTETSKLSDSFVKAQLEGNLPGLSLEMKAVPFKIRIDLENNKDYGLLFGGWGPDYADPMTFMDLWLTDGSHNNMAYSNPEFDKMIQSANEDTDLDRRWKTLQDAEKLMIEDDAAVAPMYQRSVNLLIQPKVKGFAHHAFGPDYSYQWIKITK